MAAMNLNDDIAATNLDDDLKEIDISNYADDDCLLKGDSSPKENLSFYFIFPFVIFVLCLGAIIFFPHETETVFQQVNYSAENSIVLSMSQLSPWSSLVKATLSFTGVEEANFSVEGTVNATLMREGMLVMSNSVPLPVTPLSTISGVTEPIILFATENINFDTINVSFGADGELSKGVETSWTFGNSKFSMYLLVTKMVLAAILLPYILRHVFHFLAKDSPRYSPEQTMTAFLSIMALLYLDPFYGFHYASPAYIHIMLSVALRDIAMSYVAFYCLAIFSFFGRDRNTSLIVSLAMPYMFMVCVIIVLVTQDVITAPSQISILPPSFQRFGTITPLHFFASVAFLLALVVRIASASGLAKQIQLPRYILYTAVTLTIGVLFVSFMAVATFTDSLKETAASKLIPAGFVMLLTLLMEWAHESTGNEIGQQYARPEDGDDTPNPIGVDEDPEIIEQKEMLEKIDQTETQ